MTSVNVVEPYSVFPVSTSGSYFLEYDSVGLTSLRPLVSLQFYLVGMTEENLCQIVKDCKVSNQINGTN